MNTPHLDKPVARKAARYIDGANYLPSYLGHLNNRLSSGASDLYLRLFGIGLNEWRILSVLSNWPGSTPPAIGETVAMHKTVVSRSLRSLADKGLLRIVPEAGARRCELTRQGQAMHDRIVVVALERERRLLRGFSATERRQLLGLLRRLLENVESVNAYDPEAAPAATRRRG